MLQQFFSIFGEGGVKFGRILVEKLKRSHPHAHLIVNMLSSFKLALLFVKRSHDFDKRKRLVVFFDLLWPLLDES